MSKCEFGNCTEHHDTVLRIGLRRAPYKLCVWHERILARDEQQQALQLEWMKELAYREALIGTPQNLIDCHVEAYGYNNAYERPLRNVLKEQLSQLHERIFALEEQILAGMEAMMRCSTDSSLIPGTEPLVTTEEIKG